MNEKSDILLSWEQVKDTYFGKWLTAETDKVSADAVHELMSFAELAPLLRVQGFRSGVQHWRNELAELKRTNDLDEQKLKKKGLLARIGLGG